MGKLASNEKFLNNAQCYNVNKCDINVYLIHAVMSSAFEVRRFLRMISAPKCSSTIHYVALRSKLEIQRLRCISEVRKPCDLLHKM